MTAFHYNTDQCWIPLVAEAKVVDITGKHPSQRTIPGVVMSFGMGDMSQLGYVPAICAILETCLSGHQDVE